MIVSSHGGNYVLSNVVQEANVTERRMLLYPNREAWDKALSAAGCETDPHDDMHGGEIETSLPLHAVPEVVRDRWQTADHLASNRGDFLTQGMRGYTVSGIIGRPSLATADRGAAILDGISRLFAEHLSFLRARLRRGRPPT